MAPTVIATARCKIITAVATVIVTDIVHFLSNNNSTVNQRSHCNGNQRRRWKPLQRLNTFSQLYFTFKNSFRNGCNGTIESHCNGDS